ncbi:MAG: DUF1501 domain-containing protein [Pararhodobacter sp.]|nr:DUF1501 domain-containing protein [Pararhodobacter sp.]
MDRRSFLRGGLMLGCSAAAMPFLNHATFASVPGDNRLVVVILRGALDGLDLLRPAGAPELSALRPTLAAEPGLPLDNFYHLHPSLEGLMPLWRAGDLGFVDAVSTPYRDRRSHFDGQNLLEAGTAMDAPRQLQREGWLNRLLQVMPGAHGSTAFAIGREAMPVLDGPAPVPSWAPDTELRVGQQGRRLLAALYELDAGFSEAGMQALALSQSLDPVEGEGGGHLAQVDAFARFAAARLSEDTRIVALSLAGWDTHAGQAQSIRRPLERLERLILSLRAELGPVWERTTILAMTEFGRTVRENGTRGTDHGTAGAMLTAGGAVRGGRVLGRWPGLGESDLYAGRDLMPTADVRAHAAWALRGLFGTERAMLEQAVFPGLDLGRDPGLLDI